MNQPNPYNSGEVLTAIRSHLEPLSAEVARNDVLDQLEANGLSIDQWRLFVRLRYSIALGFEDLLKQGIRLNENRPQIRTVLESNLRDEQGVGANGKKLAVGSHDLWRREFCAAVGVQPLRSSPLLPFQPPSDRDLVTGAILALEHFVPVEFRRVQAGRDLRFPDEFVINEGDSRDRKQAKARARLYLDHHIVHDAKHHYPDLETVVSESVTHSSQLERLQRGAEYALHHRRQFYQTLSQIL